MKGIAYFIFILFLEISCGFALYFLYWLLSSSLFEHDFSISRINEAIYYAVILLPPFVFCWAEYLRLKKEGLKQESKIYLYAGIVYLTIAFPYMLVSSNYYLLGN